MKKPLNQQQVWAIRFSSTEKEGSEIGHCSTFSAGDIGAGLLRGEQRFLEAQALAADELPDRVVGDGDASRGEFGLQCNVRCGF